MFSVFGVEGRAASIFVHVQSPVKGSSSKKRLKSCFPGLIEHFGIRGFSGAVEQARKSYIRQEQVEWRGDCRMSENMAKGKQHYLQELTEMLQEGNEPKEKIFAVFCHRHGVSMDECKKYYDELMAKRKVKEK